MKFGSVICSQRKQRGTFSAKSETFQDGQLAPRHKSEINPYLTLPYQLDWDQIASTICSELEIVGFRNQIINLCGIPNFS